MDIFDNILEPIEYSISDYIDHIVYINLASRTDRYIHITKQLDKMRLKADRFDAFVGQKGYNARLACKKSHLSVIEHALDTNKQCIMILEDDAVFHNNFLHMANICFKTIPNNWDMLFLGHCVSHCGSKINPYLCIAKQVFCTHCYCIQQKAYKKIISILKNTNMPIDHAYNTLVNTMHVYLSNPSIVSQIPNRSDIGEGSNYHTNLIQND